MVFAEDLSVFFNNDDFCEQAVINGKAVPGIFSYGTVVANEVETRKPVFTCAEVNARAIDHGNVVQLQQQTYQVIGIKRDGTGIITLILEQASHEI